jgi:iron complex outermembrane receptor protein
MLYCNASSQIFSPFFQGMSDVPLPPLALDPTCAALLISSQARALELPPQVITANPLGSEQLAAPTTVLEGDDLTLQQQGSLGET